MSGQPYSISVSLDAMWDGRDASIRADWGEGHQDFAIEDGVATVAVPSGVAYLDMGVVSGRLATTNRARAIVLPSIVDLTQNSQEADL
ncbi:MAG: hypothetical protein IKF98_13460 [Clostridia bacterium]|nr:hypothetical protein [Clostridia bacterium]